MPLRSSSAGGPEEQTSGQTRYNFLIDVTDVTETPPGIW